MWKKNFWFIFFFFFRERNPQGLVVGLGGCVLGCVLSGSMIGGWVVWFDDGSVRWQVFGCWATCWVRVLLCWEVCCYSLGFWLKGLVRFQSLVSEFLGRARDLCHGKQRVSPFYRDSLTTTDRTTGLLLQSDRLLFRTRWRASDRKRVEL